eukprot:GGOE01041699.1.p1 GENE.GGOE01041699.1~~GGOE01041699.1.p1  ORF type:complete len:318 (-),score=92.27 GGOE01041699.1:282-1235(-)
MVSVDDPSKRLVLMELKFETLRSIGKGAFGTVLLLKDRTTGKEWIAKSIDTSQLTENQQDLAMNEARVLAKLQHPHIIQYEDCYSDSVMVYIVMEYAAHGDLWQVIQTQKGKIGADAVAERFTEDQIMRWFVQVASALHYLHANDVLHRDLKSKNVLLAEPMDNLKIADFGLSKELELHERTTTVCGTPHYMAPEVLLNEAYDAKCDVWALGCILYEMATLEHAFRSHGIGGAAQMQSLMAKVTKGQYKPVEGFSSELVDLVGTLFSVDPKVRPSCQQVMLHPFVHRHFVVYAGTVGEECKDYFTDVIEQLQEDAEE